MAAGRPSDYKPEFCELVIEYGKLGKSKTWMAANLGVCRTTFDNWCQEHPEFLGAIKRAMVLSQAWWEDHGQENTISTPGRTLNAGVYTKSMAARFPDEWREKVTQEHTGPDGGPIKTEDVTPIDAARRIAFLLSAGVHDTKGKD